MIWRYVQRLGYIQRGFRKIDTVHLFSEKFFDFKMGANEVFLDQVRKSNCTGLCQGICNLHKIADPEELTTMRYNALDAEEYENLIFQYEETQRRYDHI